MIKKLRSNWLTIALTLVVLFSLVLSGIIWTDPFQYERPHRETTSTQSQQFTTQSIGEVYLPTTIVRTNNDGKQVLLYSQRANLVNDVKKNLRDWKMGRTSEVKTNNSDVYLSYLRNRHSLMLNYPDSVSSDVFNETFGQSIDTNRVKGINHIVIPLDGGREIYLLRDYHYSVYRVQVSQGDFAKLPKSGRHVQPILVDYKIIKGHAMMMYPDSFRLPKLAYQISNQRINNLSTNLLSTNQHTSVTSHDDGGKTIYTDGTNRHLVYDHATGTVDYENDIGHSNVVTTSQLYVHFYNTLVKTGMPLDNIRFDQAKDHHRTFIYRTYVEGFPIINTDGYGGAKLQATQSGIERYWLSLYTVQVPLPLSGETVKLPSTTTVINELHASSRFKDITDLRVGYLWKNSRPEDKVVKIAPTYFVKYHNHWVDYTELLK